MAQRPHVPAFGNWKNENNGLYTAYFDNARKGKVGGKMINPNDPEQNPEMFPVDAPQSKATTLRTTVEPEVQHFGQGVARPRNENQSSRETDSPSRYDSTGRRITANSYPQQRNDGVSSGEQLPKRSARQPGTPDRGGIEQSPLHPHSQAKVGGRVGLASSSSWEKKQAESNHGLAPRTPGRSRDSRMKSPERAAAVPRFGEWDENNPASADGYTGIFNKVREEKQSGGNLISIPTESTPNNRRQMASENSKNRCCFL